MSRRENIIALTLAFIAFGCAPKTRPVADLGTGVPTALGRAQARNEAAQAVAKADKNGSSVPMTVTLLVAQVGDLTEAVVEYGKVQANAASQYGNVLEARGEARVAKAELAAERNHYAGYKLRMATRAIVWTGLIVGGIGFVVWRMGWIGPLLKIIGIGR